MEIGVDIGGTKIEVVLRAPGGEIWSRRIATPKQDYSQILSAVRDLVRRACAECGKASRVGIGAPGSVVPTDGRVRNSNLLPLNGQRLKADLEWILELPVRLENDADCFALSEARSGAAKGAKLVFGATLGTGVGGGICIQGKVWTGRNGLGGEWGHNPLPWPEGGECEAPRCYCGHSGCLEQFLSGTGLSAEFERRTGRHASSREILTSPDAACRVTRDKYLHRMARSLASVINLLDPDVIVIGGGLSEFADIYQRVPDLWGDWVFADGIDTPLKQAANGPFSPAIGASMLWED